MAIRRFDDEARSATDPGPRWGSALSRVRLAEHLLREGDVDKGKRRLEEALGLAPELARAREMLDESEQ